MNSITRAAYLELIELVKRTSLLGSCASLLGWDEQTYLPTGGAEHRANQLSLLAGLSHDWFTSPRIGELLSKLEQSGDLGPHDSTEAVNVRETRRSYDQETKLPKKLVEELSRVTTLAQQAWVSARKQSSFSTFLPWLEKIVALKREQAAALGNKTGVPYDALLDLYEPGATTAQVADVFAKLRKELVPLVAAILNSSKRPDATIIERRYPAEAQRNFSLRAAKAIGFDFETGRLDVAAHPFCSGIGPGDCRLTTRYDEHHFNGAFFGTLHEAGHGIYEQGLPAEHYGTPCGDSVSLGIHESQSRMWENFVGRSRSFWTYFYPQAQETFQEALTGVSVDAFHAAINDVRPSFIRVEADEATYNLHIMLRFELEQKMVSGDLAAKDVPDAWNEVFARDFQMQVDKDSNGCLQDIHWSGGMIGYFPTYALGNMYAAQLFNAARRDLGDLDLLFARGEFTPLKEWLNNHVHASGKRYPAGELVQKITGEPLSHEPLIAHLRAKYGPIYGIS